MSFAQNFPDFLTRNSDTLLQTGLGLLSGRTATEQAANALRGFSDARKVNMTINAIEKLDPSLALAARSGSMPLKEAFALAWQQNAKANDPETQLDLRYKQAQINKLGREAAKGDAPEYGLAPIYGTDANGNPVILQTSKAGTIGQAQLPEGVRLSKEPIKMDVGTGFVLMDPITRQNIGFVPKNTAEEKAQEVIGKNRGEAAATLPVAQSTADQVTQQIESLKNDPYLPDMVGAINGRTPDITSDAARVKGKMDQIQGGAFLQARQLLKGGGAITDYEGQKAEQAYARLNRAQSIEDYKAALDDFNHWVREGVKKLQAQSGSQPAAPAAPAAPSVNYKSKYGLD